MIDTVYLQRVARHDEDGQIDRTEESSAVRYSTAQYFVVQYRAAQCSVVYYSAVQQSTVQYRR